METGAALGGIIIHLGGDVMHRFTILLLALAATALCGCVTAGKPAWVFYDECSNQTSSFQTMVACGKQRRNEYCEAQQACGAVGNSLVQYADALAQSVNNHEMTEAEAQRRWIEFKTAQINNARQQQIQAAAAIAASGPVTCVRNGNVSTCY